MKTIEYSNQSLYDDLVANRHIIPMGVQGIFARGAVFEDVLNRFGDRLTEYAVKDGAEPMLFPPCVTRPVLQKSGYLESFPQFVGTVFSFTGNDAQHREMAARIHSGSPWGDLQTMTDVCLTPAACYNVYPLCTGVVPENGHTVDVQNWVFRHEPSPEPTRMQYFRCREVVRVGTPEMVLDMRNLWLERGLKLLLDLQLPAQSEVASDPFFGRGGRMMAVNQLDQKLKFEIVVPVISEEKPTAVCSFNYHQDKFGELFDITTKDGQTAHTACVGFGMERIVMALFKHHGMDVQKWPKAVREVLWS
jgi:seryl-tRNA synthetase